MKKQQTPGHPVQRDSASESDAGQSSSPPEPVTPPRVSGDGARVTPNAGAEPIPDAVPIAWPIPPYPWGDSYPIDPGALPLGETGPTFSRRGELFVGICIVVVMIALGSVFFWPDSFSLDPGPSPRGDTPATLNGQTATPAAGTVTGSWLSIVSSVPDASIAIDFDSVGVAPLQHYPIKPGAYVVTLRKPGYAQRDTVVFIHEGEGSAVYIPLTIDPGRTARNSDASLLPVPRYPAASASHTAQQAPARSRSSDYTPSAERNERASRADSRRADDTGETGMLLVTSEPAGGLLYVDGSPQGDTPIFIQDVMPGNHSVVIRHDGFAPYTTRVDVEEGGTAKVAAELQSLSGTVVVLVQPWGSIYIDGKLERKDTDVQYQTDLPVGKHYIKVVHPTLGSWNRTIQVEGGATQRLFVTFQAAGGQDADPPPAAPVKKSQPNTPPEEDPAPESSALLGSDGIYVAADEPPQLIGGIESLYRRAQYPAAARQAGLEGTVYLRFVVSEEGRVQNAVVSRGIGMGCDMEALRLINAARYIPGKVQGRPVKVWQNLQITFQLAQK